MTADSLASGAPRRAVITLGDQVPSGLYRLGVRVRRLGGMARYEVELACVGSCVFVLWIYEVKPLGLPSSV